MDNLKKILEVLNDLIRINKDREAGYHKVSRELTPAEHNLRSAFERKALESRNNISQLQTMAEEIQHQIDDYPVNDETENRESFAGRIYNIWNEVKDFFTGKDNDSLVKSCADGEAIAKSCYETALTAAKYPQDISRVLNHQKSSIDASRQELYGLISESI